MKFYFFPYNSIITLGEGEYKHLSIYNFFKGTLQNFFFLRKGILQNLLSGFDLFVFFLCFYIYIYFLMVKVMR